MTTAQSRDIVLDPFGGSGSTLIACDKTGRRARLVELDPGYCDVIVRRWQDWAGGTAVLDGDGRTFEEAAAVTCGGAGQRAMASVPATAAYAEAMAAPGQSGSRFNRS